MPSRVLTTHTSIHVTTLIKLAVIDGGANVMCAFRLLLLAILYCFAHKLHLCVKRALGLYGKPPVNAETRKLSEKHRHMLKHFSKSPKDTNLLLDLQRKHGAQPCKPKQDVITRWTSTAFSFLRTLILFQSVFQSVFQYP